MPVPDRSAQVSGKVVPQEDEKRPTFLEQNHCLAELKRRRDKTARCKPLLRDLLFGCKLIGELCMFFRHPVNYPDRGSTAPFHRRWHRDSPTPRQSYYQRLWSLQPARLRKSRDDELSRRLCPSARAEAHLLVVEVEADAPRRAVAVLAHVHVGDVRIVAVLVVVALAVEH